MPLTERSHAQCCAGGHVWGDADRVPERYGGHLLRELRHSDLALRAPSPGRPLVWCDPSHPLALSQRTVIAMIVGTPSTCACGLGAGELWVPFLFLVYNGGDLLGRMAAGCGRWAVQAPRMSVLGTYTAARALVAAATLVCHVVTPGPWRLPVVFGCASGSEHLRNDQPVPLRACAVQATLATSLMQCYAHAAQMCSRCCSTWHWVSQMVTSSLLPPCIAQPH